MDSTEVQFLLRR